MQGLIDWLSQPWPWYVSGFMIALLIPLLALYEGKPFGVSRNFRHICAAILPGKDAYLRYDWKQEGLWNLTILLGAVLGGWVASVYFNPHQVQLSAGATQLIAHWGIKTGNELSPAFLLETDFLFSIKGVLVLVLGGFLIGFGTRYANGCTSGHAIAGLSNFQLPSLVAVVGFFIGGLLGSWFVLPILFKF
ncbi:MAG TPA: YeeE/YedE thiosulfate transporter family protein [Rhodothermales bacterium]|nr:YeeE/YedE thiosulfate transporter family protein [Rhodothermales bacterium]HRR09735.1 YeeE/YedE thiosulfate transporter family protein [Rhodothermales bacterium]